MNKESTTIEEVHIVFDGGSIFKIFLSEEEAMKFGKENRLSYASYPVIPKYIREPVLKMSKDQKLMVNANGIPVVISNASPFSESPIVAEIGEFRLTYEVVNGVSQLKVLLIDGVITISPKTSNSIIIGHKYK